jgi:hypothetical protein
LDVCNVLVEVTQEDHPGVLGKYPQHVPELMFRQGTSVQMGDQDRYGTVTYPDMYGQEVAGAAALIRVVYQGFVEPGGDLEATQQAVAKDVSVPLALITGKEPAESELSSQFLYLVRSRQHRWTGHLIEGHDVAVFDYVGRSFEITYLIHAFAPVYVICGYPEVIGITRLCRYRPVDILSYGGPGGNAPVRQPEMKYQGDQE